jgi:hypothetical protein
MILEYYQPLTKPLDQEIEIEVIRNLGKLNESLTYSYTNSFR